MFVFNDDAVLENVGFLSYAAITAHYTSVLDCEQLKEREKLVLIEHRYSTLYLVFNHVARENYPVSVNSTMLTCSVL